MLNPDETKVLLETLNSFMSEAEQSFEKDGELQGPYGRMFSILTRIANEKIIPLAKKIKAAGEFFACGRCQDEFNSKDSFTDVKIGDQSVQVCPECLSDLTEFMHV